MNISEHEQLKHVYSVVKFFFVSMRNRQAIYMLIFNLIYDLVVILKNLADEENTLRTL